MFIKNRPLIVGFAASGLLSLGLIAACLAQAPTASPRRGPDSPTVPHSIVLLTDGRLLRGPVTEDDEGIMILQRGGTLRYRRKEVVKVFATLADVYDYKLAHIPAGDPDEQLTLAKWCLQEGLKAEAVDRLKVVLDLNPTNRNAGNMLASIEAQSDRQDTKDRAVIRTEALSTMPANPEKPNAINEIAMMKAARAMGALGPPVIFDLPPAVAVKRFEQFKVGTQRVMLKSCAKCHDERYAGDFKLVDIKTKRDENHLTYMTNLDATLRLIDQTNPAQSPLLTNSLLPHGPNQKPIFRGYNDPAYQVLATWVRSVVTPTTTDARVSPTSAFGSPADGGTFATDGKFGRDRPGIVPPMPSRPAAGRPTTGPQPEFDPTFPVSPLVSGVTQVPQQMKPKTIPKPAAVGEKGTSDGDDSGKTAHGLPEGIPLNLLPPDVRDATPLPKNNRPVKKFGGKIDPSALEGLMKKNNPGG